MRKLRPLLLASVAVLALSACDGQNDIASEFVRDEAQCASQSDPSACRQALADARIAHQRTAPAFASQTACEERFGQANCQAVADVRPTAEQLAAGAGETVQAAGGAAGQTVAFEAAMAELEKIVASMEAGQLSLEASLENYRRGAELLTLCQGQLQAVQDQVKVLEDGLLKDFTLDAAGARVRPGGRSAGLDGDDADSDDDDDDDGRD
jgi:exodeoxyribonuclease VII small subunit